jgi:hypothetical protein
MIQKSTSINKDQSLQPSGILAVLALRILKRKQHQKAKNSQNI